MSHIEKLMAEHRIIGQELKSIMDAVDWNPNAARAHYFKLDDVLALKRRKEIAMLAYVPYNILDQLIN